MKGIINDRLQFDDKVLGMKEVPCVRMASKQEMKIWENGVLEEHLELIEAYNKHDIVGVLDAWVDLLYFHMGLITRMIPGIFIHKLWKFVHTANMTKSKVKSSNDSKRGCEIDAKKPDDFISPEQEMFKLLENEPHEDAGRGHFYYPMYNQTFWRCGRILQRKNADYNTDINRSDYYIFGLKSIVQHLWQKALRLVSLTKSDKDVNYESMDDSVDDLINYGVIYHEEKEKGLR